MTSAARLLALRVQGFKSFAERTVVEFDGGISAIVGPNGAGKSNLADALRWALGEQGRSLRARKSEDVIFAGSERRAALGMADVTLVLDNSDGLLPVEYGHVELGRRLYRSGENEYLLNRQRIRLRDLVDLLDAGHLADNAFLFIGQGMVDQALALRPEERRPLFEEVAGVRRHERRRRKAEEQLAESEANLARVDDILAELRPQARRLAIQAEQQASRVTAGDELAGAIILAAHARWHDVAARDSTAAGRLKAARVEVDRALDELDAAERRAALIASDLTGRATLERERREAHEALAAELADLRLRSARLMSELEAIARDRVRLAGERRSAEADIADQRRTLAEPAPARDDELERSLADAERSLADALAELAGLRAAKQAEGEALAAIRRAEAAREAELETARRRLAEADRHNAEEVAELDSALGRRRDLETKLAETRAALAAAQAAGRAATVAVEAGREAVEAGRTRRQAAIERAGAAGQGLAATRGRLEVLEARLAEDEARSIARAAKRRGGRRIDEDLVVDQALRAAVEAALGESVRGYLVEQEAVPPLAAERGVVLVAEAVASREATGGGRRAQAAIERASTLGGGPLGDAVRRDATGAVRRLLDHALWVPSLAAALELQSELPFGWIAVVGDGSAVVDAFAVTLGRPDSSLERRAEAARLAVDVERLGAEARVLHEAVEVEESAMAAAEAAVDAASAAEADALAFVRRAEEDERIAGRDLEAVAREAAWHEAQVTRLAGERARLMESVGRLEPPGAAVGSSAGAPPAQGREPGADAAAAWEGRVTELRQRRDRLAADHATHDAGRRTAEGRRAKAEAAITLDEDRMARADRESASLEERAARLDGERDSLDRRIAAVAAREAQAREALADVRSAEAADRERLASAERDATGARERMRRVEDVARTAEVGALEARLGLEAIREQLLVELAGLGDAGLARLTAELGGDQADSASAEAVAAIADAHDADDEADDAGRLEAVLDAVAPRWAARVPPAAAPSSGRLTSLRRRYHDLGAVNPFAVDEYREVRERLDTLESQAADLHSAIEQTRQLIGDLNVLIADQFRTTFRALESAFDGRFQQLFGGGFARLSLTEPADLAATGVEIVARPPGKKAQALAMLSGGERALTAVALLFAMLEVRPVPFCVLDEVDAALDEANVGRFSEALRDLADRTQFIVITHNRGTIEAADALYGVTAGDDSVSRVISLRLEEAQAIADERRSELLEASSG